MKLTDSLPVRVPIDGRPVPIHTDFRVWIKYEQLMRYDRETTVGDLLRLVYGGIPKEPGEALQQAEWFYLMGDRKDSNGIGDEPQANYDFDVDSDVIYASFRSCYGIDLYSIDELHWWAFRSLMYGLPGECAFRNRVECRTVDVSKLDSKTRAEVMRIRERYPLPEMIGQHRSQEERDAALIESVQQRYAEVQAAYAARKQG